MDKRNHEGYYDPTAYEALTAVIRQEKAKTRKLSGNTGYKKRRRGSVRLHKAPAHQ